MSSALAAAQLASNAAAGWCLASVNQTGAGPAPKTASAAWRMSHAFFDPAPPAADAMVSSKFSAARLRTRMGMSWGFNPAMKAPRRWDVNMGFVMDAFSVEGPVSDRNDGAGR